MRRFQYRVPANNIRFEGIGRHEPGGGRNAVHVRFDDVPVHARSQAEVVRVDNQPPDDASLAGCAARLLGMLYCASTQHDCPSSISQFPQLHLHNTASETTELVAISTKALRHVNLSKGLTEFAVGELRPGATKAANRRERHGGLRYSPG
jgi:hypothetical protein